MRIKKFCIKIQNSIRRLAQEGKWKSPLFHCLRLRNKKRSKHLFESNMQTRFVSHACSMWKWNTSPRARTLLRISPRTIYGFSARVHNLFISRREKRNITLRRDRRESHGFSSGFSAVRLRVLNLTGVSHGKALPSRLGETRGGR